MNIKFIIITLIITFIGEVTNHGFLSDPPARSSAWREDPELFPINHNDDRMNCGSKRKQWGDNDGKCGICGEEFYGEKKYEKGGRLYRGLIVRTYNYKIMNVTVNILKDQYGWFEFRLCNVDKILEADHACLDKNLLADVNGHTRFETPGEIDGIKRENLSISYSLIIPKGFECNHCVLQWKWNVGNSWGNDFITDEWCNKCGPQEQFYGCADIRIVNRRSTHKKISRSIS